MDNRPNPRSIWLIRFVIQALRESQKTISEQAQEIKSLQCDVDDLQEQLLKANPDSASSNRKGGPPFEGKSAMIVAGEKFSIVECPWLALSTFDSTNPFPHDPESPERFATETSYDEGTLAVVLSLVPEKWQKSILAEQHFKAAVRVFKSLAAIACQLIHSF